MLGSISGVNGASSDVNVGIGTTTPDERLHVVGSVKIEDGTQAAGNVLTSDENGLASWQTLAPGADNLGNHTATQNLKLDDNWLSNDGGNEGLKVSDIGVLTTSGELVMGGNLKLDGNWLSNDGGNEGLKVSNTGVLSTSGKLKMGGNIKLDGNWLSGDGDNQGIYVSDDGHVGIGTNSPNYRLEVRRNVSGNDISPSSYVAEFRNTNTNQGDNNDPSILRLRVDVNEPLANTNYIQFLYTNNGSIYGSGNVEGNGNGGVKFETTGSDYGEELDRLDPSEEMEGTDVVGVFGGKISKRTDGADWVMAISANAAFVGNANTNLTDKDNNPREVVAFIGQVPVKVRGDVNIGDYILASGLEDGTAIAVAPDQLQADQSNKIVGRAWEAATGELNLINTVVGLPESASTNGALLRRIEAQQGEIEALKAKNEQMAADIREIKALLSQ